MALTSQGFRGSVVLADNGGDKSTLNYVLTAATVGDAITAMGAIVAALGPITNAVVVGYSVREVWEEETVTLPADGVQNEVKAIISARIDAAGEKFATLRIPAPSIGIFAGTSGEAADRIDGADSDLGTYLALFGSAGVATVSDGETLLAPGVATVRGRRT